MKRTKNRKSNFFLTCLLSFAIVVGMLPTSIFAETKSAPSVDENMARTLAIMFVSRNFEILDGWDYNTRISEVVPLYGSNDEINAYCVKLENDSVQAGYITVSTNLHESLIQEYSDQALPVFETENTSTAEASIQCAAEDNNTGKLYYYGPLRYGKQKQDKETAIAAYADVETIDHYEENSTLITSLQPFSTDISLLSNSGNIDNPYTYLQQREPGTTYQLGSRNLFWNFDGYVINDRNGCAVYAVAAVLTHHLKASDGIPFSTRVEQCKSVFVSKKYGTADNYYLEVGDYKPYITDCLALYNTTLRADSDLFFPWNSACNQIDANCPVLINIWDEPGSGYHDHTVVAYGWLIYINVNNSSKEYRFYRVRDGYDANAVRYVDVERLGLYYITKIFY